MKFLYILLVVFITNVANAQTIFTARAPESQSDKRQDYNYQLLELALLKTVPTHGPFKIQLAVKGSNMKRAIRDLEIGKYPNYFVRNSVSSDSMNKFHAVEFPVDRGIVGYRIAFTSVEMNERINQINTLKDLQLFSVVQGIGWLDTEILKSQGFNVMTSSSYESMFTMVARGRADLFMRGANEILGEWETHRGIPNLTYDDSFVLHYPLPRFFFTNKRDILAAERVYDGLIKAYEDGSLIALWEENYRDSIEFVKLHNRKIFYIKNPAIKNLDQSYLNYIYNPFDKGLAD